MPCFDDISQIKAIEQGLSHHCYQVVSNRTRFFVKHYPIEKCSNKETIQTKAIKQLAVLAGELECSPRIIYQNDQWQVQAFITGKSLQSKDLILSDKLKIAIELMVISHKNLTTRLVQLPTFHDLPVMNCKALVNELFEKLSQKNQEFTRKYLEHFDQSLPINPNIICHGDINFTNIIVAERSWLIDFDCAIFADAEFDIAMMISINELIGPDVALCIDECINIYNTLYYNSENTGSGQKITVKIVTRYLDLCCIINGLWFLGEGSARSDKQLINKAKRQFGYVEWLNDSHNPSPNDSHNCSSRAVANAPLKSVCDS